MGCASSSTAATTRPGIAIHDGKGIEIVRTLGKLVKLSEALREAPPPRARPASATPAGPPTGGRARSTPTPTPPAPSRSSTTASSRTTSPSGRSSRRRASSSSPTPTPRSSPTSSTASSNQGDEQPLRGHPRRAPPRRRRLRHRRPLRAEPDVIVVARNGSPLVRRPRARTRCSAAATSPPCSPTPAR